MLLQTYMVGLLGLGFCVNYGIAYNEEAATYKWSPRYLSGRKPITPIYQLGSGVGRGLPSRVNIFFNLIKNGKYARYGQYICLNLSTTIYFIATNKQNISECWAGYITFNMFGKRPQNRFTEFQAPHLFSDNNSS